MSTVHSDPSRLAAKRGEGHAAGLSAGAMAQKGQAEIEGGRAGRVFGATLPYIAGLAAVSVTTWIRLEIGRAINAPTLIVYTIPVLLSAYWGGMGPGLVATLAAVLCANYYLLQPTGSFAVASSYERWQEAILVLACTSISVICGDLYSTRRRAQAAAIALQDGTIDAARLAAIIESSDDAIIGKDLDGIVTSWNDASARIFGYSATEMVGHPLAKIIPPKLLHEEDSILKRLREGQSISHYETERRHKDGTPVYVSISVAPIRDGAGRIVGASKIARNITERHLAEIHARQLQQELAHVARLSEMGQMSAAIAHELNQPLTAVMNYASAAQSMLSNDNGATPNTALANETLTKVLQQAARAGSIIRYLRDFVEKRDSPRTLEDINHVVEEALALGLTGTAAAGMETALTLDKSAVPLTINKIQIQQVLLNLVRNSIDAMSETRDRKLAVAVGSSEPGFVDITVSDSGPGIAAEVVQRLFQPFMTTKENGMGIGLKVCQSIVEAHGGQITLQHSDAAGTTFRVRLPVPAETT